MRIARTFASMLLPALCTQGAMAVTLDYTTELGFLHSDNINLSGTDPVTENLLIPRIGFSLTEDGSNLQSKAVGQLEYRDYLGGTFGNEFRGTFDGTVDWALIPQRLKWSFADNLGLYPVDFRQPGTPGNLQQINVFSTGPTLQFRLAPTINGLAELRYTDSYAETTDSFNSKRFGGALRALYDLDATRRLSGNLEVAKIDFDNDTLQSDYTRYAGYAGYSQKLAQFDLDAALGYSYLDFDNGEHTSGPLVRAQLDWRATASSKFGLGASWEFADAAASVAAGSAGLDGGLGGVVIGGASISPDVYEEHRVVGTYAFTSVRLTLDATSYVSRIRYERVLANDLDRDEYSARLNLGYRLRPTLTLGVFAGATRRDYQAAVSDTRDYGFGSFLSHKVNPHWAWRADLSRVERHSVGDGLSYDENSAYLRVIYSR